VLAERLAIGDVDHLGPGWRRVLDGLSATIPQPT